MLTDVVTAIGLFLLTSLAARLLLRILPLDPRIRWVVYLGLFLVAGRAVLDLSWSTLAGALIALEVLVFALRRGVL